MGSVILIAEWRSRKAAPRPVCAVRFWCPRWWLCACNGTWGLCRERNASLGENLFPFHNRFGANCRQVTKKGPTFVDHLTGHR